MCLQPDTTFVVPDQTRLIAQAASPKGNRYMKMHDELGLLYADQAFQDLFPPQGQPAEAPWRLATVTVFQFVEGLSDRQAAEAVRARIDWKYALCLEWSVPGFDSSVLCEFRTCLLENGAEARLFESMLTRFQERKLLKARGRQRTDSTHMLALIRHLNRLECCGEALRLALNALAQEAPDWLLAHALPAWFERYSCRVESGRLPSGKAERDALTLTMGADGIHLLEAVTAPQTPSRRQSLAPVQVLRRIWIQQFYFQDGQLHLRTEEQLPPCSQRIHSPHDLEARYSVKRQTQWTGYKVHLTETCDPDWPRLLTQVQTTPAATDDSQALTDSQASLAQGARLPGEHLVDQGYTQASSLVSSRVDYGIQLLGPVQKDSSRQALENRGFDLNAFAIDWPHQRALCPGGKKSLPFTPAQKSPGKPLLLASFKASDCRGCVHREACTHSQNSGRTLKLHPQAEQEALQAARHRQKTPDFGTRYAARAGIEGTLSQGVRAFGLRRSRYIGQAKAHLQNLMTAAAMNFCRVYDWRIEKPRAETRKSAFAKLKPAFGSA